ELGIHVRPPKSPRDGAPSNGRLPASPQFMPERPSSTAQSIADGFNQTAPDRARRSGRGASIANREAFDGAEGSSGRGRGLCARADLRWSALPSTHRNNPNVVVLLQLLYAFLC